MSLDQCTLNRWDLEEKTIDLTFEILLIMFPLKMFANEEKSIILKYRYTHLYPLN